jgi:hypothetical protein
MSAKICYRIMKNLRIIFLNFPCLLCCLLSLAEITSIFNRSWPILCHPHSRCFILAILLFHFNYFKFFDYELSYKSLLTFPCLLIVIIFIYPPNFHIIESCLHIDISLLIFRYQRWWNFHASSRSFIQIQNTHL